MQRLAREKICLQERLASLKGELSRLNIEVDLEHWKNDPEEQDSNSTSTATGKTNKQFCISEEQDSNSTSTASGKTNKQFCISEEQD